MTAGSRRGRSSRSLRRATAAAAAFGLLITAGVIAAPAAAAGAGRSPAFTQALVDSEAAASLLSPQGLRGVRIGMTLGEVPAQVDGWEIGFDGVGPLQLGMTEAAARAAVPGLDADGALSEGGTVILATAFHDDRLVTVRVGGWRIEDPQEWGSRLPHAGDIRLGDSGATALDAFPEASYFRSAAGGLSSIMIADREGRLLTFSITKFADGSADASDEESIQRGQVGGITIEDARVTHAPDAWGLRLI